MLKSIRAVVTHPLTDRMRRLLRRFVVTCAVILAVAIATSVTMDLGPSLKHQAEEQGSRFMRRPMHIGKLRLVLWSGTVVVDDLMIEGLTPASIPFLTARQIKVSIPWRTLFERRFVLDTIAMTDWHMHVEQLPDGRHNFPKLTPDGPRGQSRWTTTLKYVRASNGEFTYQDHGTPWGVVARNLDITVSRPGNEYVGRASFSDGTVAIQNYVPFRTDMDSSFKIDRGRVVFDRIDLNTDGTRSVLNGDTNLSYWPELMFHVKSTLDFPRMRELFFAQDNFTLFGTGEFDGTFHLFKDAPLPNGQRPTGRELKGEFRSKLAGVDEYRFGDLRGNVRWTPALLEVTDATSGLYGGAARFAYRMAPLGQRGTRPTNTFDAMYENVDLTTLMAALEIQGIRLDGRASGHNFMEWQNGRFAERTWNGDLQVAAPEGVRVMTRDALPASVASPVARGEGDEPFDPALSLDPVPIGGALSYVFGPEWVEIGPSRAATPSTYVEFEGQTAYGEESRLQFHVTSADWQDSDRLLAGLMTAFRSPTRAIPIGGSGTFDGVMLNSFRQPRFEGTFTGEQMRAWDVVWGSAHGTAAIENNYVDVKEVVITSGDSTIAANGRFSIGYPRRDGGEQINAIIRLTRRPVADLRHAFELDDYDLDGLLSGEFHLYGDYERPLGFGTMEIAQGVAYTEPFDSAAAGVQLEGNGVRLEGLQIMKQGGRATGSAFVGWNGTYSFNLDGRSIPVESIAAAKGTALPLSGLIDFTAGGSGSFDLPRYTVRGTIRDFFVADEGIGQVVADLGVANNQMTLKLEAASPRLAVSGSGRIALTPGKEAELTFTVADTSLDPYVRAFEPRLSPYTTAVASGSIRVVGQLSDVDHLLVDATVDRLDARLFDYALRNASPIRLALDNHSLRIVDMVLIGQDTQLDVSGLAGLHDERIDVRMTGAANLAVLQGFIPNIRSSGQAELSASFEGPLRDPAVNGTFSINNGRIRHFALPHALENISGPLRFDSRGVTLDGVTARLGGGDVQFGGRIDKDGYLPGRLDVTMVGTNMRLRFPEGMRSVVDADLALQGTIESATLSGRVNVRDALYTAPFDATGGLFDLTSEATPRTPAAIASTLPLRYDIRISAPSTLQVRNNVMRNTTASADLQLQGTYDRPLLFGRAEIERGEFLFEGKRFVVTRGTIDFNNPTRIEPFLDIETEARVRVPGETYRITVTATGPLGSSSSPPSLTYSSDPFLPEVELLALLFSDVAPGRDVEFRQYASVTPQEQLVRERAARALTGTISSEVGRAVEQTIGVDTFQITPSLSDPNTQSSRLDPAARVTIGKRLSDRVYLTYSRSLASTTRDQVILLEYDQTDRFSWILSSNEDRTYALELRLRRNF